MDTFILGKLTDRLMLVSGKIGNTDAVRSLEVTVVNHDDIVPWKYPPRKELIYVYSTLALDMRSLGTYPNKELEVR